MRGMKGMYGLMAMAAMMGGLGGVNGVLPTLKEPNRHKPKKRELSPEEEAVELEKRQAKFLVDLEKSNVERKKNFPKWKQFEVHGFLITASNPKNAFRDIGFILKRNGISIVEETKEG